MLVLLVAMGVLSNPQSALAQSSPPATMPPSTPPPSAPPGTIPLGNGNVYSAEVAQEDINSYRAALADCGTPSLECLVHYTFTYVNIEILTRITGPNSAGGPTSSNPNGTQTPVADNGGFVGDLSNAIGMMFANPPAATGVYVADVLENAHIVPRAYAQGLGFVALNPVLNLWKVFRNLAYTFFVIIFIVIGFMIMFRKRISGQTAISAQQAIPSVITSLIFVTFSYAIAGFLIDLMYLSMYLVVGVFETVGGFNDNVINYDIFGLMGVLFKAADPQITADIVETFLQGVISSEKLNAAFSWAGGLTISVIIAIAILIGTFKLFFELLQDYARVVLYVVTAPVMLMVGAIPGKNVFGDWIKKVVGNLLPFPTVLLVVTMFYFFVDGTPDGTGGFVPPFLFGSGQASTISSLMGLAIILALPDIVKHFREQIAGKGGIGEMIYERGMKAAETGWKGGELIPGAAWSNTNKLPWGGLSARNLISKPFFGTAESRKSSEGDTASARWNRAGLGRGFMGEVVDRGRKLYDRRVQRRGAQPIDTKHVKPTQESGETIT